MLARSAVTIRSATPCRDDPFVPTTEVGDPGGGPSSPGILADMIARVSSCERGTDAWLSRWSAPRTNDLDSLPGTRAADSTYLRRFWSPASRETAGRHGGMGGIADKEVLWGPGSACTLRSIVAPCRVTSIGRWAVLLELDPVIPSAWTDHLGETFVDHEPSLLPGIGPSSRWRHRSGASRRSTARFPWPSANGGWAKTERQRRRELRHGTQPRANEEGTM